MESRESSQRLKLKELILRKAALKEEPRTLNPYLINPGNTWKLNWDMLITVILLYSCIATPVQIALYEELDGVGKRLNQIVDSLFFIDIVIIFNSAIYDDEFEIVDDRQEIVKQYF